MYFQHMVGWQYAAAMIFWFSFVIIFCFILFNFLIAIIVDAFMAVKVSQQRSTPVKVSQQRSTPVKVSQQRSTPVKVSQCTSTAVEVSQCRSTAVKVSQHRSMAVKESSDKASAIYQDMYLIVVRFFRRVASPYRRYSRLLRHLIRLGAQDTAHAVLEKSIRQSGQQCLSSSLQCGREARGGRHDGSSNMNGQADADGDGRADAVANGGPGRDGAAEQKEAVSYKSMQAQAHFDAQQQVLAMVGAEGTGLIRGESTKGLLASGGVAKSQAGGNTNTQLDAHASTTAAADPGSTAAADAGSAGGSMVEPAVQRRRSFWRLKTLDERETVVVVGERHLNAHSLSAILRRAHARMTCPQTLGGGGDTLALAAFLSHAIPSHLPLQRRSLSDEQEGDLVDVAALGAVLLSELGESLPTADSTAAGSTDGGEAAKEGDLLAMRQRVEALRADVARGFDQVRQQLATDFQSSHRIQLPGEASPSLLLSQLANGPEEAGRGAWEQVMLQVEKIRKEAQRERAEGLEILQELRRELQLLRAARARAAAHCEVVTSRFSYWYGSTCCGNLIEVHYVNAVS
ncbi:unnamed protein product [Closterium sp. Yama58-4]|nr:unnamed protein product [Closterium sp. Yama58-4]